MQLKLLLLISLFALGFASAGRAQKYTEPELRRVLDSLSLRHPGFNNKLQLNLSDLPLYELINSVALENNLNVSVDPSLTQTISYNFFDAQVKDMFVFLYQNFELEYYFVGTIMSVKKRMPEPDPVPVLKPKKIEATYNSENNFLSLDLQNDTLWRVTQELTRISGKNIILSPDIRNKQVNAYFLNRPFEQVMEMLAQANGLDVIHNPDDSYVVRGSNAGETLAAGNPKDPKQTTYKPSNSNGDFILAKTPEGKLNVFTNNVPLNDLIRGAAEETGEHYIIYTNIEGKANLEMQNVSFEDIVKTVFQGSKYSYRKEGDIYVIGENTMQGLRYSELIRLENRTIEVVKSIIPKDFLTDLDVIEFQELNGLVVTGDERKVRELKSFISSIDVVVPMVQIDVMLLFSKKSYLTSTGIKAGLKDAPTQTNGTVFPNLDVEMGAQTINDILNAISGFGFVNLGQVTENFYLSLQALESNNIIEIESTPKISTLNGHKAVLSIGETTYYQETQVNVQTSVTQQGVLQSKIWKSIEANLSVTIKPFVSADELVTLSITVKQDDFSGKIDPSAPPNISTQNFESVVRVKNGEVILLGGLEKKRKNDSGSGVPFLARIPVIKWFFSSRSKEREKSKLHILIRPVVTY